MKKYIPLIFLFSITILMGQETPKIVYEDSLQLKLKSLDITVKVIGNFATTTYDMKFFNELDRTLEGELAFPLGQGQVVSNFSMDVNGKLRDAVVVEKELARVAFESTVRQNIDPGLLEKTEGNNYKARVYPILPKADKHIVITYEQELFTSNKLQTYELPLGIEESLDNFSITINVLESSGIPKMIGSKYRNFFFKQNENVYEATLALKNHVPDHTVTVQIPNDGDTDKVLTYNDYFYVYKKLSPKSRLKSKPKKITLLWDASYSLRNRNLEKELTLLEDYLAYLRNVDIQFVSFNNRILENKIISIKNGEWEALKKEIRGVNYDGGTSFETFKSLKMIGDETLLFTDGMANLGSFENKNKKPVYTINSTVSANHEVLNAIATRRGGTYVNLIRLPHVEAVRKLKHQVFQYLGVEHGTAATEVYPRNFSNVSEDFSISGQFSDDTSLELLFGYGGKVTERVKVSIEPATQTKLVKRLWAKQKLKFLNRDKKKNKDRILALAKSNHLITDYTSMLILDRVEDYVRYRITPPQELRAQYKELLKYHDEEEASRKVALANRKKDLFSGYRELLDWYTQKFSLKAEKPKAVGTSQSDSGIRNGPTSTSIDSTRRIVSGTVLYSNGEPLPGVNVLVKGTTNGTTTDFDGNFTINAEEDDDLVFSSIGYTTVEHSASISSSASILMTENNESLEELVIVGYGTQRESPNISSPAQEILEEEAYEMPVSENDQIQGLLAGKVAGVEVSETNGEPGSATVSILRGLGATTEKNSSFYVIDGSVPDRGSIPDLAAEDIANIEIIKGDNAIALYGNKAANGLILITTKNGLETKQDAIAALNEKIADRIELKSWNPDTPYIKILEKEETVAAAYTKYMEIRNEYANSPSFYLDVSDFFDKKGSQDIAITVLTNLIEIELDNHELMKALAYKLEYLKQYDLAVMIYRKVLEIRPEEPQSYRDLALALERSGEVQESYDLLYKVYNGNLLEKDAGGRFTGIEQIAFVELTRLVNKYEKELKLKPAEKERFGEIAVDVRVVIDWNHNDTDIDLWVNDPNGEKAYYKNTRTKIGGRVSQDVTQGYGPEEFMLKKALDGEYPVTVNYFADNVQKISGPTILKVTLFTNYARENEVRKTIIVRLDGENGEIEVGSLRF